MDDIIEDRIKALLEDHYRRTGVHVTSVYIKWNMMSHSRGPLITNVDVEGDKDYVQ
jgi:hypothetical protein